MRTRFLNVDYFSSSPNSSSSSSQTLGLLNLPIPQLTSLNFSSPETYALLFDSLPTIDISQEIDGLEIDRALSKLLKDVTPHIIGLEDGGCIQSAVSRTEDRNVQGEGEEKEATETIRSTELPDQFTESKSAEDVGDQNIIAKSDLVHFEVPEIYLHLEESCISELEPLSVFSEVPQTGNTLDVNSPGPGNLWNHEAEESVYFIEDLNLENLLELKADLVEDENAGQGLLESNFCPMELNDINLEIPVRVSAEDEHMKLLEQAELEDFTQMVDLSILDCENVFRRMEDNLLQCSSHTHLSFLEVDTSLELLIELDFISTGDKLYVQANSACQGITDGNGLPSLGSVLLEELQILDEDPALHFQFFNCAHFQELELCREMALEDVNCKSINELIVSNELALVDDIFKSMPIPVFWDCDLIKDEVAVEFMIDLKAQAASASDGIYLDWHILEEEQYRSGLCSFYEHTLEGVDIQDIGFDLTSVRIEKFILDLIFSDNNFNETDIEEISDSTYVLFYGLPLHNSHLGGDVTSDLLDEHERSICGTINSEDTSERPPLFFNSVSPFNDLEFFLNPSKGRPDVKQVITERPPTETIHIGHSKASICTDNQLQPKNFVIYEVHLSHEILAVIDILKNLYLDILESNPVLRGMHKSFDPKDGVNMLKISKQVFLDVIRNLSMERPIMGNGDGIITSLATLCAIKQMTWYICFYGIHTAGSYFNRLCESLSSLRAQLSALRGSFPDTDVTNVSSHPSLNVIQDILSNTPEISSKTLVLADKVYWPSLKNLLTCMGLSFHVMNESNSAKHVCYTSEIGNILVGKDCLLASPESISPDFPFDKFKIILEYGGYCGSSRIPPLPLTLNCRPCLHFLKMELDSLTAAGALCDGVTMPQNTITKREEKSHLATGTDDFIDFWMLEQLLNFVPLEDGKETKNREESNGMPKVPNEPFVTETVHMHSRMKSSPESVIVVNTQNSGKELIVSRRSTYQKILACEREGIQVIERDSNLPIDIIINPAVCLLWYERSNIAKGKTTADEYSSWLSSYIENIAANILSVLSFSFSGCILIFEGGADFLATVMESSDGLCAAAASLGIDLQFFCSYSPELTDEIILRSIASGTDLIRGLFPKLPELETLGESFLCKFPSINPLTAQAILSNGGLLVNFLEWSLESRISAVQRYQVSDESISLFSFLCRYGEREDSHSIMTDSSSSVSYSSGPDSKSCPAKLDSGKMRYKYTRNPHNFDMSADDLIQHEMSNHAANNIQFPRFSSSDSLISKDLDLFNDAQNIDFSFEDFLGQEDGLDAPVRMMSSKIAYPHAFQMSQHNLFAEAFDRRTSLGNRNSGKDTVSNLEWVGIMNSEQMLEEVGDEVIDGTHSKGANLVGFPFSLGYEGKYPMKKPRKASEFFSNQSDHPVFPTAAEIDPGSYMKIPVNHQKQSVLEGEEYFLRKPPDTQILMRNQNNMGNEDMCWRSSGILESVPKQEERSNYRGTPLKNAVHSSTLQKGSPWSIEFLNRMREKSKSRQQLLPSGATPSPNIRRNRSNSIKRRSPSIIEFFKYQGSSTCSKIPELKKQKISSGSFKNKKALESLGPTWTPLDKRARRTLSFTTNGKGGQSKLIWNDKLTK